MNQHSSRATHSEDRSWPEPPPVKPHYEAIMSRDGHRLSDPPPSLRMRLRRWVNAFRPQRRNHT